MTVHLVARPLTPDDYSAMVRLCHPEVDFEVDPGCYREEWDTIWECLNPSGIILENMAVPGEPEPMAIFMGAFIRDDILEECIHSPSPYCVKQMAEQCRKGRILAVSHREVAAANVEHGLNLYIIYFGWDGLFQSTSASASLRGATAQAYADRFGGHRLRYIIGELSGAKLRDMSVRYGVRVLNDFRQWAARNAMLESAYRPYLVGIDREEGIESGNLWLVRLFTYYPPRFHFTDSQRKILLLARDGYTDTEIAAELGATADAVKKRWVGIYDRVHHVLPNILPESPKGGRGAEKRRALLAHLRDRPEELRPYDTRLLRSR